MLYQKRNSSVFFIVCIQFLYIILLAHCQQSSHCNFFKLLPYNKMITLVAASSSLDAHVRLWDLEAGKLIKLIDAGPGKEVFDYKGLKS